MVPPPPPGPPPDLGGGGGPPPPPPPADAGPAVAAAPVESEGPPAPPTMDTAMAGGDPSQSSDIRLWERAWTPDEMRSSIGNWTLAADAGLLLYLKDFAKRMTGQIADITSQVDGLVTETKRTETRLHNVFNDFLMLSNTQFVENRVYDFEETKEGEPSGASEDGSKAGDGEGDSKANEKGGAEEEKTREQREAELIPKITAALKLGIQVMDEAFEKVEVTPPEAPVKKDADDDEDDDEDVGTAGDAEPILVAKDPYLLRPLPHIIGSGQFFQSDEVGLMLAESEGEEEEEEDDDSDDEKEKKEGSDEEFSDDLDNAVGSSEDTGSSDSEVSDDDEFGGSTESASDSDRDSDGWSDEGGKAKGEEDEDDVSSGPPRPQVICFVVQWLSVCAASALNMSGCQGKIGCR